MKTINNCSKRITHETRRSLDEVSELLCLNQIDPNIALANIFKLAKRHEEQIEMFNALITFAYGLVIRRPYNRVDFEDVEFESVIAIADEVKKTCEIIVQNEPNNFVGRTNLIWITDIIALAKEGKDSINVVALIQLMNENKQYPVMKLLLLDLFIVIFETSSSIIENEQKEELKRILRILKNAK